jgi:hypothetical protein
VTAAPSSGAALAFRPGQRGFRYADTVDHGGGISPSALMFLCFIVVGVGFFLFTRFDGSNKKKK